MCSLINSNIGSLATCLTSIISGKLIPVIGALAAVLFVWGVVNYFIIGAGEEAKRTQGKQFIMWGIIAFVIISSVWALVNIVGRTFGVDSRLYPGVSPNRSGTRSSPTNTSGGGSGGTGTTTPFPDAGNECKVDSDCEGDITSDKVLMCRGGYCVEPL